MVPFDAALLVALALSAAAYLAGRAARARPAGPGPRAEAAPPNRRRGPPAGRAGGPVRRTGG